jgi:hypothetical protein
MGKEKKKRGKCGGKRVFLKELKREHGLASRVYNNW